MSYVGFVGFAMMIVTILLLLWKKMIPAVVFIVVPIVAALAIGSTPAEISGYIGKGLNSVVPVATMFIFAVLFFGIMSDAGVFRKIVGKLTKTAGSNVLIVMIVTVVVTIIGHLDGSGATTYLIAIPPLLAIYQKLKIRPVVLMGIVSLTMGVMNSVPWGGPVGRLAAILEVPLNDIWKYCIPAQLFGLALCAILAVYLGRKEMKLNAVTGELTADQMGTQNSEDILTAEEKALLRPNRFWLNILLILAVVLTMMLTKVQPYAVFMVGLCISLAINYPSVQEQTKRIEAHASTAFSMAFILLASAVFLGIMTNSPMMDATTKSFLAVLPKSLAPHMHIVFAFITNPLSMIFNPYASMYGVVPVISNIVSAFGIPAAAVGAAYQIALAPLIFILPITPAMYLGLGLAGVELRDHIKFTYKWSLLISTASLLFVILIGVMPI
ncbi:MAG TPA: citrate:H+ symporter [Spirochaetaceae bacterium]|jgi:CitMHS family citrate-Mg2+:H+ or citrate-Ca2+:H+ symporter|nr:citrate:H+ symporter [Spirochaetaceae bacterium]